MNSRVEQASFYAYVCIFFVALGGFLFGYNTGVISGALMYVSKEFSLSIMQQGHMVSIILIGALLGSMAGGALSDRLGRKKTILLTALIFLVGIGVAVLAKTVEVLLMGRFITGIAVGITSITIPLYLAEIAPPKNRGAFVSSYQLALTIGILFSYGINFFYSKEGEWRWMFGLGSIPALVQFVAMFFLPESPSWLMANGHTDRACKALSLIRKEKNWTYHLSEMKDVAYSHKKSHWSDVFSRPMRKAILVGLFLSIFQIISGINTVTYYAPTILQTSEKGGIATTDSKALIATIVIGIVNVIATSIAVWLLDRAGRRKLLLIGAAGMTLGLLILILSLFLPMQGSQEIKLMSLIIYVVFFAISLGPVTWVLISEIYPLHIRGRAMSVAIFANWLSNYLISLFFPDMVAALSLGGIFTVFTVICLIAFWFIYRFVPETKGKSLEAIEESLR